jgi:sigma-B regulation protein RsbU (phosphoserine phosphatase)
VEELDTNGFLLGILSEGIEFEQKEKILKGKTRLIIFTDGINEAINQKEEQFGVERIQILLKEQANNPPEKFILNLQKSLAKFTGDNSFEDDITIIVADRF